MTENINENQKTKVEIEVDPYESILDEIKIVTKKIKEQNQQWNLTDYEAVTIATKIVMDNSLNYTLFEITGGFAEHENKE